MAHFHHVSLKPDFVTKNGREAIVSMSPDVYEGLLREALVPACTMSSSAGWTMRAPVVFPTQRALNGIGAMFGI